MNILQQRLYRSSVYREIHRGYHRVNSKSTIHSMYCCEWKRRIEVY